MPRALPLRLALRRFAALGALAFAAVALVGAEACSSPAGETKGICKPGQPYFCLCGNGDQGEQTCLEDGQGYEPCAPCDDDYQPPVQDEDVYRPPLVRDGGRDAPAATCGDKVVDRGEACDDGNAVDGDGCSAKCQPDGDPVSGTACPGREVHLWDETPVVFDVRNTNPAPNTLRAQGGCGGSTGSTGAERVLKIVAHAKGKLVVGTSAATYNHLLYAGTTCSAPMATVACANASATSGDERLEAPIENGESLVVVVDSAAAAAGTLKLSLALLPP